jgi:hypothetical protein
LDNELGAVCDQYLWAGAVTRTRDRESHMATAVFRGLVMVEVGFTGLTSLGRIPAGAGSEQFMYARSEMQERQI